MDEFMTTCNYNTSVHTYEVEHGNFVSFSNGNNISIDDDIYNDGNGTTKTITNVIYYALLFKVVSVLVSSIIFIVGLIGNILVVIVVCRTKNMHTPTNCYLISLAVADSIVLISATLPSVPEPFFEVNEWPWGRPLCSILIFLQYLGVDASSLSITAFTVERYIAICHPMKAQKMCTVNRAKRIIVGIWVFTIIYCAPWLGLTVIRPRDNFSKVVKCTFRLQREAYLAYYLTDLVVFYVIPLLIAGILYALIARILFSSRITKAHGKPTQIAAKHKQTTTSRKQVVRMLIVIVGVFAIMWLPYRFMVVYNSLNKSKYLDLWFLLLCRVMVYINSAINPILYNAMSVKFRRAFRKLLCCGKYHINLLNNI
ncbi:hypothetical protein KUTeg_019471 [Tegillarca granosa]|uniref:Thyrotropin-releasing hormone receptor n=1 Tax=Tegillarca granosa TaxID=220873 RepID=A0ABQ9EI33_TEGGR|nr:hypothetical protein KUTeg_019471 [Tegillarca granosa]